MTDQDQNESKSRSWLERLSQVLLREPQDREQLVTLLRDAKIMEALEIKILQDLDFTNPYDQ